MSNDLETLITLCCYIYLSERALFAYYAGRKAWEQYKQQKEWQKKMALPPPGLWRDNGAVVRPDIHPDRPTIPLAPTGFLYEFQSMPRASDDCAMCGAVIPPTLACLDTTTGKQHCHACAVKVADLALGKVDLQ